MGQRLDTEAVFSFLVVSPRPLLNGTPWVGGDRQQRAPEQRTVPVEKITAPVEHKTRCPRKCSFPRSRRNALALTVALNDSHGAQGRLYWDDGVRIGKLRVPSFHKKFRVRRPRRIDPGVP